MNKNTENSQIPSAATYVGAAFLALVVATTVLVAGSTEAQAQDIANTGPCPGQRVATYPMNEGLGTVEVYYARIDGGTNCFKLVAGKTKGTSTLLKMEASADGDPSNTNMEEGMFKSFAGPVVLKGVKGRCVSFSGEVEYNASTYRQAWSAKHCG